MTYERLQELREKIKFVKQESAILTKYCQNIKKLEYLVYYNENDPTREIEELVIIYKGGHYACIPCEANSIGAIHETISKNLYGAETYGRGRCWVLRPPKGKNPESLQFPDRILIAENRFGFPEPYIRVTLPKKGLQPLQI